MIVQLEKICKSFGDMEVIKDISFTIDKEEIICVLGPSGCGKSTMLNIISGLTPPNRGCVDRNTDKIGYVFQEARLLPWKTLYENIKFVKDDTPPKELHKLISDIGLEGFENCFPNELSGGMKQRCSIARAFNYNSELLLMDEPFKSLDYTLRIKMISQLIGIWEKSSNSILFVTHEIDEALLLGNRIIILSNRPARIIRTFEIKISQRERKLSSKTLTEIRNEIIDILVESNEQAPLFQP